jgi:hypothetical protein
MIFRFSILIFILILSSCSSSKRSTTKDNKKQLNVDESVKINKFKPIESKSSKPAAKKNIVLKHLTLDLNFELNEKTRIIKYLLTTPEFSSSRFQIDLRSGRYFEEQKICDQRIDFEDKSHVFTKTNFSLGVVPGILDQRAKPQRIVILGSANFHKEKPLQSQFKARIIGGFVEKSCNKGDCFKTGEWVSSLVLVGVQPSFEKYLEINNIAQLGEENLNQFKMDLTYLNGQNQAFGNLIPSLDISKFIDAKTVMSYMKNNHIFLGKKRMSKIKRNCKILYNKMWNEIGARNSFEQDIENLNSNEKSSQLSYKELLDNTSRFKRNLFYQRFRAKFRYFQKSFNKCIKYITPSSIKLEEKRGWFFTYYTAINFLVNKGHNFDCSDNNWKKNLIKNNDNLSTILTFGGCQAGSIDLAFKKAPIYLTDLANNNENYYYYRKEESTPFGTKNTINDWVEYNIKQLTCVQTQEELNKNYSFPTNITWKARALKVPYFKNK